MNDDDIKNYLEFINEKLHEISGIHRNNLKEGNATKVECSLKPSERYKWYIENLIIGNKLEKIKPRWTKEN